MTRIEIRAEDPDSKAAQWCLGEYFRELHVRFEGGFDLARYGGTNAAAITPPHGLFVLAWRGNDAVGCGSISFRDGRYGEIKRMWVAPQVRGQGLSRLLLRHLEEAARAAAMTAVRLDTNRVLSEAQALYRKAGYSEIARFGDNPYAHHWFEKLL